MIKKCYFDSYNPAELEQVILTQQKVIDYQKENKHKDLYQILIVIDDFADDTNCYPKITITTSIIRKR